LQLGVEIANEDLGKGIAQSNDTMSKIIAALKEAKIADADLQTSGFNVWLENRSDTKTGAPISPLYHVQNTLSVTVRDLSRVSDVLNAGIAAGANNVYGLSFGIADTSKLEEAARVKALDNAKARAEQLAQLTGVKLGDPIIVNESYGTSPVPLAEARSGLGGGGGAIPIQQGQLSVSVQVNVTYSISR
jgi:uncharacterized protein YggE